MADDPRLPLGADVDTGTTTAGSTSLGLLVGTAAIPQDFVAAVDQTLLCGQKVLPGAQNTQPYAIHAVKIASSVAGATENAIRISPGQGTWPAAAATTVGAADQAFVAANLTRKAIIIQVLPASPGRVSLAADGSAAVLDTGITIAVGATLILEGAACPVTAIRAIGSIAGCLTTVQEVN